jgi:hypothetical protein
MREVLENRRRRTWDMQKYGTEAIAPAGNRLRLMFFFFPAPEGGGRTRLGGELRREEERLSRTGMCVDREETVDDPSDGLFVCFTPP